MSDEPKQMLHAKHSELAVTKLSRVRDVTIHGHSFPHIIVGYKKFEQYQ